MSQLPSIVTNTWAQTSIDCAPDALIMVAPDLSLVWANEAAEQLLGWPRGERLQRSIVDLLHPEDLTLAGLAFGTVQDKEMGAPLELRVATPRGWVLVEIVGRWAKHLGEHGMLVASLRDLTQRRRWDLATRDDEQLRRLVDHADSVTILVGVDGCVMSHSPALTRQLGHDPEVVQGGAVADLVVAHDRAALTALLDGMLSRHSDGMVHRQTIELGLISTRRPDPVPYELTIVDLHSDPIVGGFVITAHDLSRLRVAQRALEHQALHDELTDLPNRRMLMRQLQTWLGEGRCVALAFLDIDRFKPVNDLFGHEAGDTVLRALADRLLDGAARFRGAIVARHGGDEFVVATCVDEDTAPMSAALLAGLLGDALRLPIRLPVGPLQLSASVGAATSLELNDAEALIAAADAQMYVHKRASRGAPTLDSTVDTRRELAEELVGAVARGEIVVYYQPIVDLRTREIEGVEALVRWQHPKRGLLAPAAFLSIAQDIGLDREIDLFVLETACRAVAERIRDSDQHLKLTVNISADHLADVDVPTTVARVLDKSGLPAHLLWLEITEHAVLQQPSHGPDTTVLAAFDKLNRLGVRLAIDDFGTGFSSLASLVSYPINMVKIDRSFVEGVESEQRSAAMVEALLALSHRLDITAVAEGVEREEQVDELIELGCRLGQGFLLGRPSPQLPGALVRSPLGPNSSGRYFPGSTKAS